jgi:hypothetical protein
MHAPTGKWDGWVRGFPKIPKFEFEIAQLAELNSGLLPSCRSRSRLLSEVGFEHLGIALYFRRCAHRKIRPFGQDPDPIAQ